MNTFKPCVITINAGSSGIKFALYEMAQLPVLLFYGEIENKGASADDGTNANYVIDQLVKQERFVFVNAIGHRIVQGMRHTEPKQIDAEFLEELKRSSSDDPEHLPEAIKLIEVFTKLYPALLHVACFDTSFHSSMPIVAKMLPIPRKFYAKGIKRYGFHGISYSYLLEELNRIAGRKAAQGKIILAHLGNGASLAAVKEGKSVDTSMGFSPSSGILMGTRCGDLDPGAAYYLMEREQLSPKQFNRLINQESGLLGLSETSSDMRELITIQHEDSRATEAVDLFCYQVKKWIGSFAAVLGGLDTLIFSGGIGEHATEIRERICRDLQFLGIEIDPTKNKKNEAIISKDTGKVCVRVIPTNEELMIAKLTGYYLNHSNTLV